MKIKSYLVLILVLCFAVTGSLVRAEHHEPMKDTKAMDLPGPQLVTGAWMFIAAYKADPATLKALLPEGLEPNPAGQVVINMYTVPTAEQTSGFGAYTLTYLTVELKDQDSYDMNDENVKYPGRYFIHYYNSSPKMRSFTKKIGIPAMEGMTTTVVENGKLTATLTIDGKPMIVSTADVGDTPGNFTGGHFNYFGLIRTEKNGKAVNQVVKYPIPWNGGTVDLANPKIKFMAPEGHPLNKVIPTADLTWAIWIKGSFVYPQQQVIHEYAAK